MQTQRVSLMRELQTLEGDVRQLAISLPLMDKELADLQISLFQARQSEVFIRDNLDRWQKNNESYFATMSI